MTTEPTASETQRPDEDDRPDWYYEGFKSLREAENAWQCQAESRGEEQSDGER